MSAQTVHASVRDLSAYHDRTIALLRRYFRMSLEIGRMPSVLGREVFRARVTSYRVHTFEDAVIFVHDVERCVERLEPFSRQLIARVILQDYTYEEAAKLMGCGERSVYRLLPEALDQLTELFFTSKLLSPSSCQGVKTPNAAEVSDTKRNKSFEIWQVCYLEVDILISD